MQFSIFLLVLTLGTVLAVRKIYVDLGANDGKSVESFVYGPQNQKGDSVAIDGGKENQLAFRTVGSKVLEVSNDWEVYVFEANPHHTPKLKAQKEIMLKNNSVKAYHLFDSTAISVKDGTISFVLDNPGPVGDAGSTIMTESRSAVGGSLTVNCTDIVTLFKNIGKFEIEDHVLVKMDVEGAEYQIVRRMIHKDLIKYVDKISVEWHHTAYWVFGHPGEHPPADPAELEKYNKRKATHFKYLAQYKDLMSQLSPSDAEKFGTWGR